MPINGVPTRIGKTKLLLLIFFHWDSIDVTV